MVLLVVTLTQIVQWHYKHRHIRLVSLSVSVGRSIYQSVNDISIAS